MFALFESNSFRPVPDAPPTIAAAAKPALFGTETIRSPSPRLLGDERKAPTTVAVLEISGFDADAGVVNIYMKTGGDVPIDYPFVVIAVWHVLVEDPAGVHHGESHNSERARPNHC